MTILCYDKIKDCPPGQFMSVAKNEKPVRLANKKHIFKFVLERINLITPMRSICLMLLCCIALVINTAAQLPKVKIEQTPVWKTPIKLDLNASHNHEDDGSITYLLLDWQENEIKREYNYRYCFRLNNEEGVQSNSQLYFSFDPTYQKLAINKIIIHRNNKQINKLSLNKVEVMRNEEQADRLLYDGTYSAMVILDDMRVGDIIEYEYTIKGYNSIFGDHIYGYTRLGYTQGVKHLYKSFILPPERVVNIHPINHGQQPEIEVTKSHKRIYWNIKDLEPKFEDQDIPIWYNSYPACEVSSYKDWNEVRDFTRRLYPFDTPTPRLDKYIKQHGFSATAEDIMDLINFVQDEIRYLGMEMGENSHKPHHPEKVFKQRFGDCKDKSYLLCTLLRKCGVQAWPALVNTTYRRFTDERAPSPFAFNHVIVKFIYDDNTYWVDPTNSLQKGNLELLCFPSYEKALVLDNDNEIFETIPRTNPGNIVIRENFWFKDSIADVLYDVTTNYYGRKANATRNDQAGNSIAETKNHYLNFCSNYYNNLEWDKQTGLKIEDDTTLNNIQIQENYVIKEFWQHTEEDSIEFYASFYPYNLYEYLDYSKDQVRTMPLAIAYPVHVKHSLILHFPSYKNVGFSNQKDSVINSVFRFVYSTKIDRKNKIYTINYEYETLKDHVPVSEIKQYFKDYDKLSDLCGETITWGVDEDVPFKPFTAGLFISLLFMALLVYIFRKLYKVDYPAITPLSHSRAIGGWMIIPLIGLYFTPLAAAYLIFDIGFFNEATWQAFQALDTGAPFSMGGIFFFELLFNLALIGTAVFLIILFHQRRTSLPRFYVWFRAIALAGLILDTVLSSYYVSVEPADVESLTRTVINAAIWIPYFLFSERVKDTFVNRYKEETIEERVMNIQ
ncbi:DUF3857 domain-containing protein [Puteibacter caeruleilacunae]|nr:DUF3857 domain-containing protein [Puteibacter caeruleilacunae]